MADALSMTPDSDAAAFANEINQLAQQGEFNPMSLLAGDIAFHSAFLAPLSPSLAAAIRQFVTDGSGPLASVVQQFITQGVPPADAANRARELFNSAKGVLVVVLLGDHGIQTVPQLFFGSLDAGIRAQAVAACGEQFPFREQLTTALATLETNAQHGANGADLVAGPGVTKNYWLDLGEHLLHHLDRGMFARADERLVDLAYWIGTALETKTLDDDGILIAARCHIVAGDGPRAAQWLDRLLHDDADGDALAELAVHVTDGAIRAGHPREVGTWLSGFVPRFEERFGTCYELRLAEFKATAAANSSEVALSAAAHRLISANRKAARQDLTREPIWAVTVPVAESELLDPAAAAQIIGRDTALIVKRLDLSTLPSCRHGEQIRIPRTALLAWYGVVKPLMD